MIKSIIALSIGILVFSGLQEELIPGITAPGQKLEKLSGVFQFTEGPTPDANGNVYFTDQPNDRIMIWSAAGGLSVFLQPCGRSNGLSFDKAGYLWACADEKNELWQVGPDKSVKKYPVRFNNSLLNGPNDLWINDEGGIYFTDPYYQRPWWDHKKMPQDSQSVYYLFPDHKTIIRIADDLEQPNGIVGTPDGKKLFIADIGAGKTWVYDTGKEGKLMNKKLFCEMGSDGMAIDSEGNIYITGNGVTVFDKNGNKLGNIEVPEDWTANVCFGGKEMKDLFITASKGIYKVRLKVKGTKG